MNEKYGTMGCFHNKITNVGQTHKQSIHKLKKQVRQSKQAMILRPIKQKRAINKGS